MNQMMIATKSERIFRIRWDGVEERDFSLDLKRIPFSINQQVSYGMFNLKHLVFFFSFGFCDTHFIFQIPNLFFSCSDFGK